MGSGIKRFAEAEIMEGTMRAEDLRRRLFPGGVMRRDATFEAFRCSSPGCSVETIIVAEPRDFDVLDDVTLGECDHPFELTPIDLPPWAS